MKSVLLCGGSHSDIPQIECLKSLGFQVTTSGNNPDELGHKHSDSYLRADYSSPQEVLHLAQNEKFDFIVPSCNDFSYLSCAYVAEKLGYPGYDNLNTSKAIHEKDSFRKLCDSIGIIHPRMLESVNEVPRLPLQFEVDTIIKPVDLTGGKGIQVARAGQDIRPHIQEALNRSKAKRVVVEEYINGTNHGISAILKDRKIEYFFADEEYYYFNEFAVGGTTSINSLGPTTLNLALTMLEELASECNLADGLLHSQFIVKNDRPYLIEVCRRPPGDFYPSFVEMATGHRFPLACIEQYINEKTEWKSDRTITSAIIRHCAVPDQTGFVTDVQITPPLNQYVKQVVRLVENGEFVDSASQKKTAIVFLEIPMNEQQSFDLKSTGEMIKTKVNNIRTVPKD